MGATDDFVRINLCGYNRHSAPNFQNEYSCTSALGNQESQDVCPLNYKSVPAVLIGRRL